MKKLKSANKKAEKTVTLLTAVQKKAMKEKLALATQEAYQKGRSDEARDRAKITALREKAIESAVMLFEKKLKKAGKKSVKSKNSLTIKKEKAIDTAKVLVKEKKASVSKKQTKKSKQ